MTLGNCMGYARAFLRHGSAITFHGRTVRLRVLLRIINCYPPARLLDGRYLDYIPNLT
jgi:hypothetical protein